MNSFKQHVPAFVDVDDTPVFEFETTQDLLALEVVRRYGKKPTFSHFAMRDNCLMEISDGGRSWWVVGYVKNPAEVDLPAWNGGEYHVALPDGTSAVMASKDIAWSCGDQLMLKNGIEGRWIQP